MRPISRRRTLQLGGLGVAGTVVGGAGLAQQLGSRATSVAASTGVPLREPQVLRSSDGELRVTLQAAEQRLEVAGASATVLGYNDGLPGPTLHVRPGDVLRVRLQNRLARATNLHVHGLVVSPEGNGDNVFVSVDPGESFDYAYRLPDDHPPGTYWYHPHLHGSVADQVFAGLYGAIVVADGGEVAVPSARERVLVVSDITLDGGGRVRSVSAMDRMAGREGELVLVNGQARPVLSARPGERERWRVVNACTSRYLRLAVDGQPLSLLAVDSGRLTPRDVDDVVLAPGNRADLLVAASTNTVLRTLPVDRGTPMMGAGGGVTSPEEVLARLEVSGGAVDDPAPVPPQPEPRDLRGADVAARRELVFSMGMGGMGGGMSFAIDGREFDADRVDQAPAAGTVEEWTLTNTSPMNHPVHLHVWPMQVVSGAAGDEAEPTWRDVVDVPARSRVQVRIAFDGFTGRTVYHCHVLDHEDAGMMGVVEVG